MNTKIEDVFFIRRRSAESTTAPETVEVEGRGDTTTEPTLTTMADTVRPLLTSMKLFGLYFRRETEPGDNVASKTGRRWNVHMIYSLVVVILLWINVARMFSVFRRNKLLFLLITSFYNIFYDHGVFITHLQKVNLVLGVQSK